MLATTDRIPVKSFQIFKDEDFIASGRLSKKLTLVDYSTSAPECYHAGARATVPFVWESEPGTPKRRLVQTSVSLPPLTPPPSYFFRSVSTIPIEKQSTRVHSVNAAFPKCNFIRRRSVVRLSSSSENSIQSLSSPSSLSSTSPSVISFHMAPLCDYYYSKRYGFAFEAEKEDRIKSSSSCFSPFACFHSKKCNRQKNARRSGGRCSSMVRRFLPPLCYNLIWGAE